MSIHDWDASCAMSETWRPPAKASHACMGVEGYCAAFIVIGAQEIVAPVVALVLALVCLAVILVCIDAVMVRHRRRVFRRRATPLSDAEFLVHMGASERDAAAYGAIRRALAACSGVDANSILPDQWMDDLVSLQTGDGDFLEFIIELDREQSMHLALKQWPEVGSVFGSDDLKSASWKCAAMYTDDDVQFRKFAKRIIEAWRAEADAGTES